MTAFPEWFEKNKTLAAGCDAYFVKPLNTRTLSQQVAEVVARKAQGSRGRPGAEAPGYSNSALSTFKACKESPGGGPGSRSPSARLSCWP